MPLTPGTRIGSYEVVGPLGAGGMGEVYRARDTKLNRDVALKILSDAFAADVDRVARFTREAQTLAALNHPHIAQIHGLEESGGVRALAMEFVDGSDLSALIARGPMAVPDALSIARQIAHALEAAHELGIVHRDLKPANVRVRDDGTVKVLDFGLAKAAGALTNSPTVLSPARTELGVILGTAAYMSPEQAKGRVVDKRADIWAFGVVLYEMLAGQPLFAGDSVAETIGFVTTREPDWTRLPATTPAHVRRLLARCLTRDTTQRLRDIGEARVALASELGADPLPSLMPPGSKPARARPWRTAALVALGAIAGGAAIWTLRSPDAAPEQPTAHVGIALTRQMHLGLPQPSLALSPDGTRLVYTSSVESGGTGLWVRPLDQLESTFLAGSSGRNAFFSPDGKSIGSTMADSIVTIPVGAGAVRVVCATPAVPYGATWTSRDEIVFAAQDDGLFRVPASGGTPRRIVAGRFWYPDALPGGRHVIVTADNPAAQTSDDYRIALVDLETGAVKTLFDGGTYARYAASGHLVYLRERSIMAVAFDPAVRELHGSPVAVVPDVYMNNAQPSGNFAVSAIGTLVYVPSSSRTDSDRSLIAVSPDGSSRSLSDERRAFSWARVSPEGARLVVITVAIRNKAWALDLARGVMTGITPDGFEVGQAIWAPNGQQVAVNGSSGNGPLNLFLVDAQGRGRPVGRGRATAPTEMDRLTTSPNRQAPLSWSPDGKTLVFSEYTSTTGVDLWVMSLDGDRTPRPLLQTRGNDQGAAISPDGRRIAYETTAPTGFNAVYVADFPSMARAERVSDTTSRNPVWSHDSRQLYYRQGDGEGGRGRRGGGAGAGEGSASVMAVDVAPYPKLGHSKPRRIVALPPSGPSFDLLPDGRFVMVDGNRAPGATEQLNVVFNWFSALRRQVPGR